MRQTLIFILWLTVILFGHKSYATAGLSFATSDLPGLLAKGEHGPEGFFAELFSIIKEETKLDLSLKIYPWARAQKLVSTGAHEVLVGPYRSPDRELILTFGQRPIYQDRIIIITTKKSLGIWHGDLKDLNDEMIIVMRGWYYGEEVGKFLSEHKKVLYAGNLEQAQKLLLYGRGKYLFINERSFHFYKTKDKYFDDSVAIFPKVMALNGYIAYSKKVSKEIILKIEEVIAKLANDGRLDSLQKKYHIKL